MKKNFLLLLFGFCALVSAQTSPPIIKNPLTTSSGLKINSRRGTLIEKRIYDLAKFRNLNVQKIVTRDMSDNSTESVLGMTYEYETFDTASKKTLTIEKAELSRLIQSLQILKEQENKGKPDQETKYKFMTMSNIEFGGIYSKEQKSWINYIRMPSSPYNQSLNEFSKDELKELIEILENAEQNL
ncbi:hypothetical protein DRF60_09150 [Chryseobacterium elymi]|uniref:Uncharacterized protein n=1 Tax=Chryseobacterium elymi TaxID=395936 RepID=A0A3D9DKT9_9FLAO|nr:hypothetical protein [Chryseobacterium elymi]REC78603.1 hypothetical protein DRF60_09150 [Chryseobacterium elymi]